MPARGQYRIDVTVRFEDQDDGSVLVTAVEVPLFLIAGSREEGRLEAARLLSELEEHLSTLGHERVEAYLRERRISFTFIPDSESLHIPLRISA